MEKRRRKTIYVIMTVVFLFYLYIAFNMAFTQDDWTWGSSVGLGRMQRWFTNYNGRYLGNLIEILITRSFVSRVLLMSVLSTGLIYLLWRLFDINKIQNLFVIFFLVLALPAKVFAQTFGWGAGFGNYITAAFFSFLYLNIIKNILGDQPPNYQRGLWVWMIPLGVGSALFIEHVTLYNLAVAIIVVVYTFFRFRKVYLPHAVYLISIWTGAVIMFTNSGYRRVARGNYKGRSIALTDHQTSLLSKLVHAAAHIYPYYILNNTLLILALSFVGILVLQNTKYKIASWFLSLVIGAYPVYKLLWISNFHVRFSGSRVLEGLFSLVYILALFAVVILGVNERKSQIRSLFFLVSSGILVAPFLVVTPISPRCFLSSYLMFTLLVVELLNVAIPLSAWPIIIRGVGVATLTMMVMYLGVFARIGHTTKVRNQEIKQQLAAKASVIHVTSYRYPQFMQRSAPKKGTFPYKTFKLYYHIPDKVMVKFDKKPQGH